MTIHRHYLLLVTETNESLKGSLLSPTLIPFLWLQKKVVKVFY